MEAVKVLSTAINSLSVLSVTLAGLVAFFRIGRRAVNAL